jgi:hypothetical protein
MLEASQFAKENLSLRCHLNCCFLLRSIISFHSCSSCPAHFLVPYIVAYTRNPGDPSACWPVLYGLSHRYPRSSCPIWIPPIQASKRPSGGWRRAFVTGFSHESYACNWNAMLFFVFRYSGGKTPFIIIAIMLGMVAIASLTWLHRRWISRLHHVGVQRPTSRPSWNYYLQEISSECYLSVDIRMSLEMKERSDAICINLST